MLPTASISPIISNRAAFNHIHDPGGIFNFLKVQTKFELKDSKNIYYKNFNCEGRYRII